MGIALRQFSELSAILPQKTREAGCSISYRPKA